MAKRSGIPHDPRLQYFVLSGKETRGLWRSCREDRTGCHCREAQKCSEALATVGTGEGASQAEGIRRLSPDKLNVESKNLWE